MPYVDNSDVIGWKVNTPGLLQEIMCNDGTSILKMPLNIFQELLKLVAERASVMDDRKLNKLMLRLALYEVANPSGVNYDPKFVNDYIRDEV